MTIDLNLSAEERQIVGSIRDLLTDRFPVARLREASSARHTANAQLTQAIAEFGGFDLWRPESMEGAGLSIVEEALIHVEFGRFLATPGVLAAAIGSRLAHEAGLSAAAAAIASGASRVCFATPARRCDPLGETDAGALVFDWQGCDRALLWSDAGLALLDAGGLQVVEAKSTDRSVTLGRAIARADAVIAVAAPGSRLPAMARLLVSAQLLGVAQAARDMAADYAKIRTQFGAPIGSFQAIKHRCADMAIRAEVLEAQLTFAAIAERDGWADAEFQNAACRMLAHRYALDNAVSNIQVHGGIGFSAESAAHLYVLRAHLLQNLGERSVQFSNRLASLADPDVLRPAIGAAP